MLYTKKKTRALIKKLRRELAYLCDEYKRILKSQREAENELPELLLCDNYYLIESSAKTAVGGLEELESGKGDIGLEFPRVYCHMLEYIESEKEIDTAGLSAFLEEKQAREPYLCVELSALESALAAAIVTKIYESYKNGDEAMESYVKLLFTRRNIDQDSVFCRVSRLERILSADPSGVFEMCDKETKAEYRKRVCDAAKLQKSDELTYASELLELARSSKGEARSLGHYLMREKKSKAAIAYFPMLATVMAFVISVYLFFSGGNSAIIFGAIPFLLLPFFELAKQISTMIASRFTKPAMLPRLSCEKVSPDKQTLVIITTLLFGEKNDKAIFDRLEDFCHLYRGENVYFGVLGDLRDSDAPASPEDAEIIDYAKRRTEALNSKYGDKFVLFVRERRYSTGEERYMGWERKRGALIELVRFLRGGDTTISEFIGDRAALMKTKYVITLDSDTKLSHTSINRLVGCAAHPQNRPKIEKTPHGKVVVKGYGIFQPKMISSLESVSRSYFSLMQCGSGGVEFYDNCTFDLYQSVFGEGIFCGKGIFDVDAYAEVIDGAFPEDSVLSHDLLEGTRLRAAYLGDVSLVDSAPASAMSYYDRLHRWIRGDVQSLAFCRAPINALSRFKLLDNLFRALTPTSALLAVIYAALFGGAKATLIVLFALSYLIFPLAVSLIRPIVSRNVGAYKVILRSYFSYAVGGIVKDAVNTLYNVASLPYLSCISIDAIVRASWRMKFSKKHMLEWTTAYESDLKKDTLLSYFWRMRSSVAIGLLILVLTEEPITDLSAFMFIIFPAVAYWLSKRIKKPNVTAGAGREQISLYADAIWRFFEDLVGEKDNYLPPDNYQILPVEAVAHRTSPTNIGMYLCSALSARDFGLIDSDELLDRLDKTLSTVEKMKKWHGHLYNWYDTKTLELLCPTYVSTVDSGNFFCSLVALREGVIEYAQENTGFIEIAARIDALVASVEFAPLYNPARKLFYIGLDPSRGAVDENYYDLYMSEARCASYFAIARGEVPEEHWRALGRRFIGDGNHIGLASWSGTAFEYFMPALFLPTYPDSMAYEGLMFAYSINKKNAALTMGDSGRPRLLWGKSESAFYSFDPDMNYRYRAIGESGLGLVRALDADRVYAPYAVFLMMRASVKDALAVLSAFRDVGAYGKYGFFESVDLTPSRVGYGRAVVRVNMAHHMGMSLVALSNIAYDDVFCRRFMRSPDMRASSLLLAEKLPADAIIYKNGSEGIDEKTAQLIELMRSRYYKNAEKKSPDTAAAAVVSDSDMCVVGSRDAKIDISLGGRAISSSRLDGAIGLSLMFETEGEVHGLIGGTDNDSVDFSAEDGVIKYSREYKKQKISASAKITIVPEEKMTLIELFAEGHFRDICPGIVFEPILAAPEAYAAHPSFSKLFIESLFVEEEKILLFRRKKRSDGEKDIWLGVAFGERGGEIEYETKKERFLPELYSDEDIARSFAKRLDGDCSESLMATVDPVCVMKRASVCSGKYRCDIIITVSDSSSDVIKKITRARKEKKRFSLAAKKSAELAKLQHRLVACDGISRRVASAVLASTLTEPFSNTKKDNLRALPRDYGSLWRHGISGDEAIVLVDATEHRDKRIIECMLAAHRLLRLRGVSVSLVILYKGNNEYTNRTRDEISRIIIRSGSDELWGKRAGVFLVPRGEMNEAEYELFSLIAQKTVKLTPSMGDGTLLSLLEDADTKDGMPDVIRRKKRIRPEAPLPIGLNVSGGVFDPDGFWVDKYYLHGPWSYVYCNAGFGTLLTQNSLGFTWYRNSREKRLTKWLPDGVGYGCGEHIFAASDGKLYDLVALSDTVHFGRSCAKYRGELFGNRYTVCVGCDAKLPFKAITVSFDNKEGAPTVLYEVEFLMGHGKKHISTVDITAGERGVSARRLFCEGDFCAYLFGSNGTEYSFGDAICSAECGGGECFFVLGARPSDNTDSEVYVKNRISCTDDIMHSFDAYRRRSESLFSPIRVETGEREYDILASYYLPYQAYYVRMLARSGFYQSSGAYGFRDQLQDSLAALFFAPKITRRQIIRCAAHQYEEGDVQHWWHPTAGGGRFGIRSRYSDDPLWLAFAVSEYVEYTADLSLLDVEVSYLASPVLDKSENERCENAVPSGTRGNIYSHCVRAIDHSLHFGPHGLSLFGGGDWNDGMNAVGRAGTGESVWLSYFTVLVLEKFIPICLAHGDKERAGKYQRIKDGLFSMIEKHAWDGEWYLRGFYDDGTPLGSAISDECKIDIIVQSFAAFISGDERHRERVRSALFCAYDRLFDKKNGIIKLFDPPFDSSAMDPGYIKSYPAGLRENGGQYTHGVIWFAIALYKIGEKKMAKEAMDALCPIFKCAEKERAAHYRNEPYAMSADIYTAEGEYGRAGWSGYTGSAAWYLRAILEYMDGCDKN